MEPVKVCGYVEVAAKGVRQNGVGDAGLLYRAQGWEKHAVDNGNAWSLGCTQLADLFGDVCVVEHGHPAQWASRAPGLPYSGSPERLKLQTHARHIITLARVAHDTHPVSSGGNSRRDSKQWRHVAPTVHGDKQDIEHRAHPLMIMLHNVVMCSLVRLSES